MTHLVPILRGPLKDEAGHPDGGLTVGDVNDEQNRVKKKRKANRAAAL